MLGSRGERGHEGPGSPRLRLKPFQDVSALPFCRLRDGAAARRKCRARGNGSLGELGRTESLCPVCLGRIPAERVVEEGSVYLKKKCPQHGSFRALIWRDAALYEEWALGSRPADRPRAPLYDSIRGCPFDCGLCAEHEGGTCTAVMEITYRCDIKCPVCFANGGSGDPFEPDLKTIREMYEAIMLQNGGPCSVQLSGGEPTVRDDLCDVIRTGKELGFRHIQVNTNGLRIAREPAYLEKLKDSGADLIYLQFDGLSDDIHLVTRGQRLVELKIKALENCKKVGLGVLLVPTIIPKLNDHQVGDIVRFAKEWSPTVRGIHFQPVSYFGRNPTSVPAEEDRFTLPDVVKALVNQTNGEVDAGAFLPRKRRDSHCAFSSLFVIGEDGRLRALTGGCTHGESSAIREGDSGLEYFASRANRFTNRFWRLPEGEGQSAPGAGDPWNRFLEQTLRRTLSITAMPFQDAWNIDIQRLKGCCVHVITDRKRLVPLCIFHVTSIDGKRLYRNGWGS